jgi:c-di-GMP-related signal transduction protein
MDAAVASLPLSDEVRGALLDTPSRARAILDAVTAYERGAWPNAADLVRTARGDLDDVAVAYHEALRWTREMIEVETAA